MLKTSKIPHNKFKTSTFLVKLWQKKIQDSVEKALLGLKNVAASAVISAEAMNLKMINTEEIVKDIRSLLHPWHRSYVSKQTFNENKMCYTLQSSDSISNRFALSDKLHQSSFLVNDLLFNFMKRSVVAQNVHVRYFKTERSVRAESQRNPTVSSRLKKAIGKYKHIILNTINFNTQKSNVLLSPWKTLINRLVQMLF